MSHTVVVYHSGYGHTRKQAEAVCQGAAGVAGATAELIEISAEGQLADGAWETLPHAPGTADLEENIDPDAQGPLYRVGVSARIGGDSADIRAELNKMKQHRYLLRVTRRDGTVLLLGTPEQPLTFESRFESGSEGSDFRGHRCTFESVSPILSPHYVPVF